MKRKTRVTSLAGVLLVTLLVAVPIPSSAQTGGGYDLSWNNIDGTGYFFSTGGDFSLGGTIGQADVGLWSGGTYSLIGGFLSVDIRAYLFLPLIFSQ